MSNIRSPKKLIEFALWAATISAEDINSKKSHHSEIHYNTQYNINDLPFAAVKPEETL